MGANEGVRISSIVNFIKKQRIFQFMEPLREELLNSEPPHPLEAAAMANIAPSASSAMPFQPNNAFPASGTGNSYTFTIPLYISVQVGAPQGIQQPTAITNQVSKINSPSGLALGTDGSDAMVVNDYGQKKHEDSTALREALRELEAARNELYYDQVKDKADREAYYENIK